MKRGPYKPCFKCKGTGLGKPVCQHCNGYGSISLKIINDGLKATNAGRRHLTERRA